MLNALVRIIYISLLICYGNLVAFSQSATFDPDDPAWELQIWEGTFSNQANTFNTVLRMNPMADGVYEGEIIYTKVGLPLHINATIGGENSMYELREGKPAPVSITELTGTEEVGFITGTIERINNRDVIRGTWKSPDGSRKYKVELNRSKKKFIDFIKPEAAMKKFPGFKPEQMKKLLFAAAYCGIPLPTYLPKEFTVENVTVNIGPAFIVAQPDRQVIITYSKKLPNGQRSQAFSLEGGFDGLGGGFYTVTKTLTAPIGKIDLLYEPKDEDDGGRVMKNYITTEWFGGTGTPFHYTDLCDEHAMGGKIFSTQKISLEETIKILSSLKRL